jgi:hypothetical protein
MFGRRSFVTGLGLGGAATLLGPLCRRLIREALGQPSDQRRLFVFAVTNGWNHESDCENAPKVNNKAGENSILFRSNVRASNDFDLPANFMEPLAPYKNEVGVLFGLHNFEGSNEGFHGSAACGLTAAAKGQGPSIDRVIGARLKAKHNDLYTGCNFAAMVSGYVACPSFEGPGKKADAYTTPLKAYAGYFGNAAGMTPQQVQSTLELDKSLFDGMARDIERARMRLAGRERAKLDQALESTREVEKKLGALQTSPRFTGQKPPAPTLDSTGLRRDVIHAFMDLSFQVQAFGLTHVSLVSIGAEASTYSDSWGSILPGIPGDTHNGLMHTRNYEQIRRINVYQATEFAYLRQQLGTVAEGGGTMADNSLCVWVNTAGLRHHRGSNCHVLVSLAGKNVPVKKPLWLDFSKVVTGKLYKLEGGRHMGEAFVSLAQALGASEVTTFGAGMGSLPGLLA